VRQDGVEMNSSFSDLVSLTCQVDTQVETSGGEMDISPAWSPESF
jgi:hypothetical protein